MYTLYHLCIISFRFVIVISINLCIFKILLYDNFVSNFVFIKSVKLLVLLKSVFKLESVFVLVNIILLSISL